MATKSLAVSGNRVLYTVDGDENGYYGRPVSVVDAGNLVIIRFTGQEEIRLDKDNDTFTVGTATQANTTKEIMTQVDTLFASAVGGGGGGGDASAANQVTGNNTLSAINTKLPAQGQATMAASQPVVIASNQSAIPTSQAVPTATGSITTQNLVPAGAATASSAVELALSGASTLGIQVTGAFTGALSLQVTNDNTNWETVGGLVFTRMSTAVQTATIPSAGAGVYQADVSGFLKARVTGLAAMGGAAAVVTLIASQSSGFVALDLPLPAGTNTIGNINTVGAIVPGSGATNLGKAEDAVHASGDIGVMMLGVRQDAPAALAPSGDYAPPTLDADNRLLVNNQLANIRDTGHTHLRYAALTNAAQLVKASAGNLYGLNIVNPNATAVYVKFYNLAFGSVVLASTPVIKTFLVPAGSASNPGNLLITPDDSPLAYFSTAIAIAAVLNYVDTDATSPGTALFAEAVFK